MQSSGHPHELLVEFSQLGNYTINCNYINDFLSCSGDALPLNIVVKEPASIVSDNEACKGETVTFETDVTPSSPTTWKVYDENMSLISTSTTTPFNYPFNQDGSFTITAENTNFCTVVQKSIIVHPSPTTPTPDVTDWETEVCLNSGYMFAAVPAEEQYYLHWEASCGTPDAYDGPEYNVTIGSSLCNINLMHVDQITGCMSAPYEHVLSEFAPAPVNWNIPSPICANDTFNITIPSEEDVLYEWSINLPEMASVVSGQFTTNITVQTNATSGTFNLILTRSFCNGSETISVPITISDYVDPDFTLQSSICEGGTLSLIPSNGLNTIGTWTWNIEGNSDINTNVIGSLAGHNYTFNNPGTVPVSLSYSNGCGMVYETVKIITVNPKPVAELSFTVGASSINLYAALQGSSVGSFTYQWNMGLGTNSTAVAGIPTSTTTYQCTITNSTTGCSSTFSATFNVDSNPPACSVTEGTVISNITCNTGTFERTAPVGTISWLISGNSATTYENTYGQNNRYMDVTFTGPGFYTITAGESYSNCWHASSQVVAVPLIADLSVNYACASNNEVTLSFTNSSAYMTGVTPGTSEWFINGQSVGNPVNKPSGTYTVKLIAHYTYGGSSYSCTYEEIVEVNRADADMQILSAPFCSGSPIAFNDNSTNAISWEWTFNNDFNHQNLSANLEQSFEVNVGGSPFVFISLIVQDAMGCSSSANQQISINPNKLVGTIIPDGGPYCSGENWPLDFVYENTNSSNVTYAWTPTNSTSALNPYIATQTGNYQVELTDNMNCVYKTPVKNICFANTPFASISGNDSYCAYDNIQLFGETGDYTYLWTVSGSSPGSGTYNTHNLNIAAGQLYVHPTNGTAYTITLQVSNGQCVSTTSHNIFIHPEAEAPHLTFGNNVCIHQPPVNLKNQNSYPLYWNTGDFSQAINTYTEGFHTAYYIDANTGCKSKYGDIVVAKAPDFNELMTGCYEFCKPDMPKWILGPMGIFDHWDWQLNNSSLSAGGGPISNLIVPTFGSYDLSVDYAGACTTTSESLEIFEKDDCDSCDIKIIMKDRPKCIVKDCELMFEFPFIIQNLSSSSSATLTGITASNATILSPTGTINIGPGSYVNPMMAFILDSYEPQNVNFELTFIQNGVTCIRNWTFNLEEHMKDCIEDCGKLDFAGSNFIPELSSSAMSYFDFGIHVGTQMQNVQIFSDQVTIYFPSYNTSSGMLNGLFSITPMQLQALVDNHEEICFTIYACRNDHICKYTVCIPAYKFLDLMLQAQNRLADGAFLDKTSTTLVKDFSLFPNPAQHSIQIKSQNAVLKQYAIMSLTGQAIQTGSESEITIDALAPGTYLIKLVDQDDEVRYLKFIKE